MSIFKSKKFIMAMAGVVAVVVGHFYVPGEDIVMQVATLISAYIVGQGIADNGKEAANLAKK